MPSFASVTIQQTRPIAIVKKSRPPTGYVDCERFGASHRRVAVRLTIAAEGAGGTPIQRMNVALVDSANQTAEHAGGSPLFLAPWLPLLRKRETVRHPF
jgi:hypothetical protein